MISNISIFTLAVIILAYLGGVTYAAAFANKLIFPAPLASYSDDVTIFKLTSGRGDTISATTLEAPDATHLLLYSHGNGEDLGHIRPLLEQFQAAGISVLAYDYPGYGTSSGKPSEAGTYAAARAAYKYATETLNFTPEQITLYGRSLGSGPSCYLAEQFPVGGLILDSAFTSTFRVMTKVKILPWDKFDNLKRLPKVKCPVLLLHGTADQVVPFAHALKNWEAIQTDKQKLWVNGARHNNLIETAGATYWNTVLPFVQQ